MLAMGLGVMLLLCLGGVGVIVTVYDKATAIDRAHPDAVVDGFLRAYLMNRNDTDASLYQCKSGGDFTAISTLRESLIDREKQFHVQVSVVWGTLLVSGSGDAQRTVRTDLEITGSKNGRPQSRHTETWMFGLVQNDGWRVCTASKVS